MLATCWLRTITTYLKNKNLNKTREGTGLERKSADQTLGISVTAEQAVEMMGGVGGFGAG